MEANDHDDERCAGGEDGCAGAVSTAMRVAPGRLTCAWMRVALWWCGLAWWPLLRWTRRRPNGSTARRALDRASRAAPWAFRSVLVPSATGGDIIPLRDGRTLERGQAFGGSAGRFVRCDGNTVRPAAIIHPRRGADGRVVGWRVAGRGAVRA